MTFHSTNYLQANLGQTYTTGQYLDMINTVQFADLIRMDFQSIQTWQAADTFFQEHTVFIHPFTFSGKPIAGIELWLHLLSRLQEIDSDNYNRIHKGTPYYHAGIYSIFATKFKEAFEWFCYAFEQDVRTERIPSPGTPSLWILTFDTREGHTDRGNDYGSAHYGSAQKLLTEIESVIEKLYFYDSRFIINSNSLRGIVKSKTVTVEAPRALRSAWANLLAIFMMHDYVKRFIRISPNQEEAQLTAHETLSNLTLILETFIKLMPNFNSFHVSSDAQLRTLFEKIITQKYGFTYNNDSFITTPISKNYSNILTEIHTAENAQEDKLAISFTVAQRIRNYSHHMFNNEYISEEVFENLYIRIVYSILSIITKLYI